MASREELAWAAGLFEGEGCFSRTTRSDRKVWYACAALKMTDLDTMERFASSVGLGRVYGPYTDPRANRKLVYAWRVQGFERTQALVALLWFGLGERRRARAEAVLALHGTEREVAA